MPSYCSTLAGSLEVGTGRFCGRSSARFQGAPPLDPELWLSLPEKRSCARLAHFPARGITPWQAAGPEAPCSPPSNGAVWVRDELFSKPGHLEARVPSRPPGPAYSQGLGVPREAGHGARLLAGDLVAVPVRALARGGGAALRAQAAQPHRQQRAQGRRQPAHLRSPRPGSRAPRRARQRTLQPPPPPPPCQRGAPSSRPACPQRPAPHLPRSRLPQPPTATAASPARHLAAAPGGGSRGAAGPPSLEQASSPG